MDRKTIYSTRAEKYARYRWDYAPAAVQAIFDITGLGPTAAVADIGSGTGHLTKHFAGRAGQIFALEPNAEMRAEAARYLAGCPGLTLLDASAEQTGLGDHSIDLITAAHAVHWFEPQPALDEFRRILKPGGWLALLSNSSADSPLSQAMHPFYTPEYGVEFDAGRAPGHNQPIEFYFDAQGPRKLRFPFAFRQSREEFVGALLSTSFMPDEAHPAFHKFVEAAQNAFDRCNPGGWQMVSGSTELAIGRLA